MKHLHIGLGVVVIAALAAAGIASLGSDATSQAAPTEALSPMAEAPHAPSALSFEVHGGSFYFVPNAIKVKKGDTVTVNFINDGGFHDFTLDAFGVKIKGGDVGETKSATFVADKAGTYQYYCSVGRHRELGQKGTLIVE